MYLLESCGAFDVQRLPLAMRVGGAPEPETIHPIDSCAFLDCHPAAVPDPGAGLHAVALLLRHGKRKELLAHLHGLGQQLRRNPMVHDLENNNAPTLNIIGLISSKNLSRSLLTTHCLGRDSLCRYRHERLSKE